LTGRWLRIGNTSIRAFAVMVPQLSKFLEVAPEGRDSSKCATATAEVQRFLLAAGWVSFDRAFAVEHPGARAPPPWAFTADAPASLYSPKTVYPAFSPCSIWLQILQPEHGDGVRGCLTDAIYQIQYKGEATDTNWVSLVNFSTITNNPFRFVDTDSSNSPQRFYRAVLLP